MATSTPHQPANAGFAPGLRLNVGECGCMPGDKFRDIKGLSAKLLVLLSYWNRWIIGS